MAVLSPYMPKWRPEAHFELKSDVWEMKRRDLAHTKPRTAVIMHAVTQGQQGNKAGVVYMASRTATRISSTNSSTNKKIGRVALYFEPFQVDLSAVAL